jgi:hypothetical protein
MSHWRTHKTAFCNHSLVAPPDSFQMESGVVMPTRAFCELVAKSMGTLLVCSILM